MDIFYQTPVAFVLYQIKDKIWNNELSCFDEYRDCRSIDMKTIFNTSILNHYKDFKEIYDSCDKNIKTTRKFIKDNYKEIDNELLALYEENLKHE